MNQTELIDAIIGLDNQRQTSFYDTLRNDGFTEEDILTVQSAVFYRKIFTNVDFYNEMKRCITETLAHKMVKGEA